jgi:transcriptional regulator with XRE-family HTH domain
VPVTNLNPSFCQELKAARRAAKISQSELAAEVGCKQSALSMFEQGDGTKLNDETVAKLAKRFGLSLPGESVLAKPVVIRMATGVKGFCPNPSCPSHHAYTVDGRTFLKPDRAAADPVGGRFCALCGEVLEHRCPTCGAPVHEGAVCSFCGEAYIAS